MKLDSKVSLYIVPNNKKYDQKRHGDGDEDQFRSYINFAAQLNTTFDLVIDDGRARVPVRCEYIRSLFKYRPCIVKLPLISPLPLKSTKLNLIHLRDE